MAKKDAAVVVKQGTTKRPGIHAKTKTSTNKNSKFYKKLDKGQGRWVKQVMFKEENVLMIGLGLWIGNILIELDKEN